MNATDRLKYRGRRRRAKGCVWDYSDYLGRPEFFARVDIGTIDGSTVCRWTGLIDKNGIDIYERDRCKFSISETQHYEGVVVWLESSMRFVFKTDDGQYLVPDDHYLTKTEVIGTIYDQEAINED